jgi:hypothetical protein
MGYERLKTEHAGAKNGGGAWMSRAETKLAYNRKRRAAEKRLVLGALMQHAP